MISTIWTSIIDFFEWKSQEDEDEDEDEDEEDEDLNTKLEQEYEFQSGKKRKKVVENWSESKRSKADPSTRFLEVYNYNHAWLRSRVEKHINGIIQELLETTPQTTEMALLTTKLVGRVTPHKNLEEILRHLENEEISRIGVVGNAGVGKTAIMTHIHNRVLENTASPTSPFDHVYWLTVSEDLDILKVQDGIAGEIGFRHEDKRCELHRAARIREVLLKHRSKSLVILDGVSKHLPLDKVGIHTGCKLILTSQSLKVCQRMECSKIIMLNSLLSEEAEELFMEKLGRNTPLPLDLEQIAKQIVKECDGLPGKILNAAEKLIGVEDDIHQWRNVLYEEIEDPIKKL